MSTRRDFLKTVAASAVAALVDSWIPAQPAKSTIDLSAFTARRNFGGKWDLTKPFVQVCGQGGTMDLARYATDGKICVQIAASPFDIEDVAATKLPPAWQLGWRHDWHTTGWRPWPKCDYIDLPDSRCPHCDGLGVIGRDPPDCKACDGMGSTYPAFVSGDPFWDAKPPLTCATCRGSGLQGEFCPKCDGKGYGMFAGVQRVGAAMIDPMFDMKIRRHLGECEYLIPGVDYRPERMQGMNRGGDPPIMIRFAGGRALLMLLDSAATLERMNRARDMVKA